MVIWGELLLDQLASAERDVVLIAPFIKHDAMERLMAVLPEPVLLITITRWIAEEIASGVSDLEVFDLFCKRKNSQLLVNNRLHAKYYRFDDRILVGSANLTARALGWHALSNIELLIPAFGSEELKSFESELLNGSILATEDIRRQIEVAAKLIRPKNTFGIDDIDAFDSDESLQAPRDGLDRWLPITRNPEQLSRFVEFRNSGNQTELFVDQASSDLRYLGITLPVSGHQFKALAASRLLLCPLIREIDKFVEKPRRFGEVRDFLGHQFNTLGISRSPEEAWQTTMRWLMFFLPNRYKLTQPNYTEVFCRQY